MTGYIFRWISPITGHWLDMGIVCSYDHWQGWATEAFGGIPALDHGVIYEIVPEPS